MVCDHRGSYFVHFQAAVRFWNLDATEPKLASLFQQLAHYREILVLHLFDIWDDLVLSKLFRSLGNQTMLLVEIFRREYFLWLARFKQETPTRDFERGGVFGLCHPKKESAAPPLRIPPMGVQTGGFP